MAGRHGLQYVSEADISSSNTRGLPEKVRAALAEIGSDVIRLEQYLDFIKFRRFRSTLVCRSELNIRRAPDSAIIENFRLASNLTAEPDSTLHDTSAVRFVGDKEESVEMNHPLTKTILSELSKVWTRSIPAADVFVSAAEQLSSTGTAITDGDIRTAESYLVEMYRVELIKLSRFEPELAQAISETPKASDFARWQIDRNCAAVTTMTGMNLEPESDLVRLIIKLADGSRTPEMIRTELLGSVEVEPEQRAGFERQLPMMIDSCLSDLFRAGLLVG
jgi:methyltransferase-like protein